MKFVEHKAAATHLADLRDTLRSDTQSGDTGFALSSLLPKTMRSETRKTPRGGKTHPCKARQARRVSSLGRNGECMECDDSQCGEKRRHGER
jgi:hypothetical protein